MPAKVYARPLDLYAGAAISPAQLKAELRFIGYREVADVSGPAQWSARGGRFTIHTRDAFFWYGEEPAQRIRLDTAEGVIEAKGRAWLRIRADGGETARYIPEWIGGMPADGGGPQAVLLRPRERADSPGTGPRRDPRR